MVEHVSSSILLHHVPNNPLCVLQGLLPSSHLPCLSTVPPSLLLCLPPFVVQEVEVPASGPVVELPAAAPEAGLPVVVPEVDPVARLLVLVEVEGR